MIFNTQKPEKVDISHLGQGYLDVIDKPWLTIQGEGPFAGDRAVFVRLAGCNLQCPMCDTNYTESRKTYSPEGLLQAVDSVCPVNMKWPNSRNLRPLIVLTGGEPFRQDIAVFCQIATQKGFMVQIETNGTLWPYGDNETFIDSHMVIIVCSPKTHHIHPQIRKRVTNWKYIVEDGHVTDKGIPTRVLGVTLKPCAAEPDYDNDTIFIQPLDSYDHVQNRKNTEAAAALCLVHGYTLCLQVHKIAGLP